MENLEAGDWAIVVLTTFASSPRLRPGSHNRAIGGQGIQYDLRAAHATMKSSYHASWRFLMVEIPPGWWLKSTNSGLGAMQS